MNIMGGGKVPRMLLLYASQTGNAQAIARDLYDQLEGAGVSCHLKCCSQLDHSTSLLHTRCLVLVASTTGDGDPPDTSRRMWRQLQEWCGPTLAHLSYTVLGLGDTNYTNFCNFGKRVDGRLQALGAHRFYRCGWADDGTGLEEVVEPWCEGLLPALKTHLSSSCMQLPSPAIPQAGPHARASTTAISSSNGANTNILRTSDESEFANICDSKSEPSPHESNGPLETSPTVEDQDMVNEIIAHYEIDVLPKSEMERLPIKCCALPQDAALSLPALPASYLTLTYSEDCKALSPGGPAALPGAASEMVAARLARVKQLTQPNAVKTALEVTLELPSTELEYQPGDSFGVLVKNPEREVELILGLLGLKQVADKVCELAVAPGSKKRAAAVPNFLPRKSCIRHLLESCVDIRAVPKKPLLRALAECTSQPGERRRLLELVSKEGVGEYSRHVREAGLATLDLLLLFRSCRPQITTLLEHLPCLLPRPYSAVTSPLATPQHLAFAFNLVEIPRGDSVAFSRLGLCTGWLASLATKGDEGAKVAPDSTSDTRDVEQALAGLSLTNPTVISVNIYLRNNLNFRPPKDPSTPVVMVGPGTGVAPFLGFLRHREQVGVGPGEWWLFYGCRHRDRDFLYKEELEKFEEQQVLTKLVVSYSREAAGPRYVQDSIVKHGAILAPMLARAIVYVCGDARNMAKDVFEAFVSALSEHCNLAELEARKVLAQMQLDKRYLQDVWA